MKARLRVLRELIRESLYVVDERAVADAILARVTVRLRVAGLRLRRGARERRLYR